jgi:hypothetical protein
MTFPIFGIEGAPGIVINGPRATPGAVPFDAATSDLAQLFGLDRLSLDRTLVCRWVRDIDGRLACFWEPDIVPIPPR